MKMYTKEDIFTGNVENLENYKVNIFCYIKKFLLEYGEAEKLEQKAQEIYNSEDNLTTFLDVGERRFDLLMEIGLKKLTDGQYVRRYIRDHQNEFDFSKVSKTETTGNIAKVINLILEELSYCFYEPAFDNKSIEFVIDTLKNNEDIYKLFEKFIARARDSYYETKFLPIEYIEQFCKLYFETFADILFNLLQNKEYSEKIAYIHSLFEMSPTDISQEYENIKKDAEEKRQDTIKKYAEEESEFDEEFEEEEDVQHYLKDSPHYHLVEKHKKKLINFFETYFTINKKYDEDDFLDYANSVLIILYVNSQEHPGIEIEADIRKRLMCYFKEDVIEYIGGLGIEHEESEEMKFYINFFGFEILQLIAYYLLSPFLFSKEKQTAIINDFLKVFTKHECCKSFYSFLEKLYKDNDSIFPYSPTKKYHHFILMSVINFIDSPEIAKEIRKVLKKHYPVCQEKLNKVNCRQLNEFREYDCIDEATARYHYNEVAVTFLLNYMTNPDFVAPHSALVFLIKNEFDKATHLQFAKDDIAEIEEKVNKLVTNKETKFTNQREKRFSNAINFVEGLISELTEEEKEAVFNAIDHYFLPMLMTSSYKTTYLYDAISDLDGLLRKYLTQLVMVLTLYLESPDYNFQTLSKKEQYSILLQHCISFVLVEEIHEANELIPSMDAFDIKQVNADDSMKQLSTQLVTDKKSKKSENVDLNINTTLQKENNEMIKNYKKEVAGYKAELSKQNKELRKLEERVAELEEDKAELNKLRELMFSMQNSNESYSSNDDVDLEELVKEHEIVVVGGHIKLLDKIKEKYPSIRLTYDSCTYPELLIHNATHVFFLHNFMNHGSYYRAMKIIKRYPEKKWGYMSCTNLEKFEESLKHELLKD